jgi:hypothetical protein
MGFQTQVNITPAPAVAGDFASDNPIASVVAGPGQLVAGTNGCNVGVFGWADVNGVMTNTGTGVPTGFVARDLEAVGFNLLSQSFNNIPQGMAVTAYSAGDFWAVTSTAATPGQKIFAKLADGTICTGAAGATIAGFIETKWYVPEGFSCAIGELVKMTSWN